MNKDARAGSTNAKYRANHKISPARSRPDGAAQMGVYVAMVLLDLLADRIRRHDMHCAHAIAALFVATALTIGCNRSPSGEDQAPIAAAEKAAADEQHQQDIERLERRFEELERDWNQTVAAMSKELEPAAAELKNDLQTDLAMLREEIEQLRTTTAQNWWERQERELERAAEEVERDVRAVARDWKAPATPTEATTGAGNEWQARRDRLVARLEERIEAMEAALEKAISADDKERVDNTRARVQQMKKDTDRLRTASERDWWEVTRQRVNDSLERVAAEIRQLKEDLG